MTGFADQVKRLTEKYRNETTKVVQYISLTLFSSVILRSPTDTGRFRGNWQPSIGAPLSGTLETKDKGGGETIMKAQGVVSQMKVGDTVYLVNNLPYAVPLEYGYSQQAAQGMVRIGLEEIKSALHGSGLV